MKGTVIENNVSKLKRLAIISCFLVLIFFGSSGIVSLCREVDNTFVKSCIKKNPCDKTNGSIKLLGTSVMETKLVMSILKVVQKPIRYSPPQTKKYDSKIVANGNLSIICLNIIIGITDLTMLIVLMVWLIILITLDHDNNADHSHDCQGGHTQSAKTTDDKSRKPMRPTDIGNVRNPMTTTEVKKAKANRDIIIYSYISFI